MLSTFHVLPSVLLVVWKGFIAIITVIPLHNDTEIVFLKNTFATLLFVTKRPLLTDEVTGISKMAAHADGARRL